MAAKVIIDTDIGDVLVTAFALLSPELDVLGGWLEARPGRAYITVPPRGGLAELRVESDPDGPHLLGGVLPREKGGELRELFLGRVLA